MHGDFGDSDPETRRSNARGGGHHQTWSAATEGLAKGGVALKALQAVSRPERFLERSSWAPLLRQLRARGECVVDIDQRLKPEVKQSLAKAHGCLVVTRAGECDGEMGLIHLDEERGEGSEAGSPL